MWRGGPASLEGEGTAGHPRLPRLQACISVPRESASTASLPSYFSLHLCSTRSALAAAHFQAVRAPPSRSVHHPSVRISFDGQKALASDDQARSGPKMSLLDPGLGDERLQDSWRGQRRLLFPSSRYPIPLSPTPRFRKHNEVHRPRAIPRHAVGRTARGPWALSGTASLSEGAGRGRGFPGKPADPPFLGLG